MSDAHQPEVAVLHYWAAILPKFLAISVKVKILSKTHLVASRYIKREKDSLPVDVHHPETSFFKLPNYLLVHGATPV